jgi:hypothetical protein
MRRKLILTAILFSFLGMSVVYGQSSGNLQLVLTNGTQQSTPLSSIKKITFSGTTMILNYSDGTQGLFASSEVQKLLFSSATATQTVLDDVKTLSVYPNPASDFIKLNNAPTGTNTVVIYRLDGAVLLTAQLNESNQQINITTLAKGFYLLKVNNQALKFMKL